MIYQGFKPDMFQQEYVEELFRIKYPSVKLNDVVPYTALTVSDIRELCTKNPNIFYFGFLRFMYDGSAGCVWLDGDYSTVVNGEYIPFPVLFQWVGGENGKYTGDVFSLFFTGFKITVDNAPLQINDIVTPVSNVVNNLTGVKLHYSDAHKYYDISPTYQPLLFVENTNNSDVWWKAIYKDGMYSEVVYPADVLTPDYPLNVASGKVINSIAVVGTKDAKKADNPVNFPFTNGECLYAYISSLNTEGNKIKGINIHVPDSILYIDNVYLTTKDNNSNQGEILFLGDTFNGTDISFPVDYVAPKDKDLVFVLAFKIDVNANYYCYSYYSVRYNSSGLTKKIDLSLSDDPMFKSIGFAVYHDTTAITVDCKVNYQYILNGNTLNGSVIIPKGKNMESFPVPDGATGFKIVNTNPASYKDAQGKDVAFTF